MLTTSELLVHIAHELRNGGAGRNRTFDLHHSHINDCGHSTTELLLLIYINPVEMHTQYDQTHRSPFQLVFFCSQQIDSENQYDDEGDNYQLLCPHT